MTPIESCFTSSFLLSDATEPLHISSYIKKWFKWLYLLRLTCSCPTLVFHVHAEFQSNERKIIFSVLTKQKGVWFEQMPWVKKNINEA